jgi:hypothetical protein
LEAVAQEWGGAFGVAMQVVVAVVAVTMKMMMNEY